MISLSTRLVAAFVIAILASGCAGIGGERIRLSHEGLGAPGRQYTERLAIQSPVHDARDDTGRIGRATITVFAITSGSIKTESPLGEEVSGIVKDALVAGGYQADIVPADSSPDSDSFAVAVEITDFWFRNYNWFWPIVPTWGDVSIRMSVKDAEGREQFERTLSASGSSLCPFGGCGFGNATKEAMSSLGSQIRLAVTSDEFRRAISAGNVPPDVVDFAD